MAYTTINKSSLHFNTKIYTGNGASSHAITGVGFKPDFLWGKNREKNTTYVDHVLVDAIRGSTKRIYTNKTSAESTGLTGVISFDTDGYTVGTGTNLNNNTDDIVGWNWKANGQGSSNTDGSINTTYTSANTTAGFSICQWTGTGSNATIGHGLGAVPKMIFVKCTSTATNWIVYSTPTGNTHWIYLNSTNAPSSNSTAWNNTSPTSSVFSLGNDGDVNGSGRTYIAYAFADKTGYSKVGGSYTGNGNADGTFIYTGFKPSFVIYKRSSGTGDWVMATNSILGYNQVDTQILANTSSPEATNTAQSCDILSSGFKLRGTQNNSNASGSTYIYMAFGQSLVGSNNVPCTAR